MSKTLELTPANLLSVFRDKIPEQPRFFHFEGVKAIDFQQAETIVFKAPGKPDYYIKGAKKA